MWELNWVDYIILLIFALSILSGFIKGFLREILSLAILIVALMVAILFSHSLAAYFISTEALQHMVEKASSSVGADAAQSMSYIALGISFGILFSITVIVGKIIGYFFIAATDSGLGIFNRFLGGLFGIARGALVTLILVFLIQLTTFAQEDAWTQSRLIPYYQPAVQAIDAWIAPGAEQIKNKISEHLERAQSQVKDLTDKLQVTDQDQ